MKIQLSANTLMKMTPAKSKFPMQQTKQQEKAFDLSMINGKITRDTVQISKDAKKTASDDSWTAKVRADGSIDIDRAMDDYSRSQGGYLEDAIFGIMNMDSANVLYDECIAKGMSQEEAGRMRNEKTLELFGNYQEALALALKFIPEAENAGGKIVSYSDVYDEDGQLKVPAKITPKEYQKNLQSILDNMMKYLKTAKTEFPNLYKLYFAGQDD